MNQETRETLQFLAKSISYMPAFDGKKFDLLGFIQRIESLIPIIEPLTEENKLIVLNYILDKISGKPKESILMNGTIRTWNSLKELLIRDFGEKTPVEDLVDEIRLCRCDSTIENFFQKIKSILCRINNSKLLTGENTTEELNSNDRLALKHFINNLPPLAKNLIVCKNPSTLSGAYDELQKIGYLFLSHDKRGNYPQNIQISKFSQNRSFTTNNRSVPNNNNNYNNSFRNRNNNFHRVNESQNSGQSYRTNTNYTRPVVPNNNNNNEAIDTFTNQNHNNNYNNFRNRNHFSRINEPQNSGQSRRTNRNYTRQEVPNNNNDEPMDTYTNQNCDNIFENPNFHLVGTNNYPI